MARPIVPGRPSRTPLRHPAPLRHPRYPRPREKWMSICIAAKPELYSNEAVICCDCKVSTESVSSESGFKIRPLNSRWIALQAGVDPISDEVIDIYRETPIGPDDPCAIESLRIIFRKWRKRLAEACIQDRHALSLDEFYRSGKTWLDQDVWAETQREVGRRYEIQKADVQLILIGTVSGVLSIYSISHGEVNECSQVAVTGTGYAVAEAALYWRMDHDSPRSLNQTLYSVYEAKKLSEMSPYVGEKSIIGIIRSANGILDIEPVPQSLLEKQFKRFGPKPYREIKPYRIDGSRGCFIPVAQLDLQSPTSDPSRQPPLPE